MQTAPRTCSGSKPRPSIGPKPSVGKTSADKRIAGITSALAPSLPGASKSLPVDPPTDAMLWWLPGRFRFLAPLTPSRRDHQGDLQSAPGAPGRQTVEASAGFLLPERKLPSQCQSPRPVSARQLLPISMPVQSLGSHPQQTTPTLRVMPAPGSPLLHDALELWLQSKRPVQGLNLPGPASTRPKPALGTAGFASSTKFRLN